MFEAFMRRITVRRTPKGRFTVTIEARRWTVTKRNLRWDTAQTLILRGAKSRRTTLARPVKRVESQVLLAEEQFKLNGANWIAFRMLHGARPILLKCPGVFRGAVLYIEPSGEHNFRMRVLDPFTEDRTPFHEVDRGQVERALATFPHA